MADSPELETQGGSALEAAETPWMDRMAACGMVGMSHTIPEGMEPASDVANLSIMGYSPRDVYSGRAPFEAASMGIWLGPNDLAFRLNLVTLERNYTVMSDHSADHITSAEAKEIIFSLAPMIEDMGLDVHPGVSYRHLLIWRNGPEGLVTYPPHDFPGQLVPVHYPSGNGADILIRLIIKSWKILENHPVNVRRKNRCQGLANSVWPWGQGKPPRMRTLNERFGISGAVVAAVDLVKGIGAYAGLEPLHVEGATGYLDTNYQGKVEAALEALKERDFVYLHVEAPDEAGHSGQRDLKIKAIQDFDEKVVGPILEGMEAFPHWRILLMPDHQTPVSTRVHTAGPVPFILLDSEQWPRKIEVNAPPFSEKMAASTGTVVSQASDLIEMLLKDGGR
jgi:2,3-bisphosphoglycerate-independent phosphoglycerate mutase